MAEKKSQHFVPRFYLRNFNPRIDGEEVKRIAIYNIQRKQHFPNGRIADECKEDYLYTNDLRYENDIKKIEDRAVPVISEIIRTGSRPPIGSDEYFHFLTFLVLQKGRTVAAGKIVTELLAKMKKFARIDEEPPPEYNNPELFSLKHGLKDVPIVEDLCMKVLINRTDVEFITSDSPVVLFNQWCQDSDLNANRGTASGGLQIFFPISNRHLVLLYDNMVYVMAKGEQAIEVKNVKDVQAINGLQVTVADENLYYSGDIKTKEMIDKLPLHLYRPAYFGAKRPPVSDQSGHLCRLVC